MDTQSPQRPTLDEIDARAVRKRESFASLALIAPTPEMIRAVMALENETLPRRPAAIEIVPDPELVPSDR